jgi:hypothetical protein
MDHATLKKRCDPSIYISPEMDRILYIGIEKFGFEQEIAKPIL